jgi:hypothetical protein
VKEFIWSARLTNQIVSNLSAGAKQDFTVERLGNRNVAAEPKLETISK